MINKLRELVDAGVDIDEIPGTMTVSELIYLSVEKIKHLSLKIKDAK